MSTTSNEVWQGYSGQGTPTSAVTLSQAQAGALHGSSHIWVWHHDGSAVRVLLQKRALDVSTWPGYVDASAAGHIDYGEAPLQAAVRETREELGITVHPDQLQLLFVHRSNVGIFDSRVIENEFQWVYSLQLDANEHFRLLDGEVDGIKWLPLAELRALAANDDAEPRLVPHGPVYFAELFRAIELLHQT